ncbi:tetratricopeptide repeat protein [Nitrosophilus kaiyonis]|uniref:tetratricopeptide repeat protein n=1 Tax=Nitrosophilus kaiyonis TaxID=2930200 RepID=UPI002490E548|nr:hypothetical protein [Nitrosophilus kaiyonis]
MFWHKIFLFFILFVFIYPSFASLEKNSSKSYENNISIKEKTKLEEFVFKNAVKDYRYGSYYEALDEFLKILKNPKSPYYKKSLLMLGKVYLQIAKRTGIKKYLWTADSYLNLYAAKEENLDWDYYYTKANIYETLEFYEKALANYKISLFKTKKENEQIKSVIAILRVAVWLHKLDLVTKYMVLLNVENLKKEQKKEILFLRGMQLFVDEKYKDAFKYFLKTYRDFESYLIDNPQYYYLVAETAYRMGNIKFAEQLFRRILNLIKNREVLKKALLRMGDIGLRKGDIKSATNYYYQLISKYPKSKEATVAKLKLISLIIRDETLKEKLKNIMKEAEFIKDPDGFVVKTLVKNRTNYIGRFALGNFGVIVFEIGSDKLFKRLGWELSLISVDRLNYEQKEYIKDLWSSYLLVLESKKMCKLYGSNEKFFKSLFSQEVLLKIANDLKFCKENSKRVDLLEYILNRWKNDENRFKLAQALYESRDFDKSIKVLNKINKKDCKYFKLFSKNCIMKENFDNICLNSMRSCKKYCGYGDFESLIIYKFAQIKSKSGDSIEFIKRYSKEIAKRFEKDEIVKKFVKAYSEKLINESKYTYLINILEPISKNLKDSCYIDSLLAISYIRTGKMNYAKEIINKIKDCNENWSKIAKNIYESELLRLRIENE